MSQIIGIDLGTTNSALAAADAAAVVRQTAIPQLVNPGEIGELSLLPSFLFLHGPADFSADAVALPWDAAPKGVVGELARKRGAEVPDRLVASAKSWLCHPGVDRSAALLPAAAPEGAARVSPVEAARWYLSHLRHAWDWNHPGSPFESHTIVVTVPASFDAVARDLTLRAAAEAGYGDVILLEEPQAAFYAWIERHADWRERVGVGDLVLVVDVGGGTTDFSLIAVAESAGELTLERVAVGEHILLGGDNMDLALAHGVSQRLAAKGQRLDAQQFHGLIQNCRAGKETLLAEGNADSEYAFSVLGRGSRLIGGSIKAALARTEVEQIALDGFFPAVSSHDMPERPRGAALAEIGLPYAADAAITRHLAHFLRQRATAAEHGSLRRTRSGMAAPTHVLFNGGVFRAGALRQRLLDNLNAWLVAEGAAPARALEGEDLMHAVSRGAAYYGLARLGRGVRIRGGIARTYYIGVHASMPAVPGMKPPLRALTVAQFGMEEGTKVRASEREFALLVGQPADFRVFASVERKDDAPGSMLDNFGDDLEELAPVEVTLPAAAGQGGQVPVKLETEITETGQLQLWCVARDGRRWKLEYNVREAPRRR